MDEHELSELLRQRAQEHRRQHGEESALMAVVCAHLAEIVALSGSQHKGEAGEEKGARE